MTARDVRPPPRWVGLLLVCLALSGCEGILDRITHTYHGPMPTAEALVAETATVVGVYAGYQGKIHLTLDRHRYTSRDPHNVDRVVYAWATAETQPVLVDLALQRGDVVRLTTEFDAIAEGGGSMGVSDWPGHDAMDYPVGSHLIEAIEKLPR